jgi:hypothetical protein
MGVTAIKRVVNNSSYSAITIKECFCEKSKFAMKGRSRGGVSNGY